MVKRLTKTGNSVAVVLDRAVLEAAHLEEGAEVEVSTNGDVIVISPVRSPQREARFKAVAERIEREHAGVFARLAK